MIRLEIYQNNTKVWFWDNIRHRANGPTAVYSDGFQCWFWDGLKHRTDGPAIIRSNGHVEYWINGKELSEYEIMFIEPTI